MRTVHRLVALLLAIASFAGNSARFRVQAASALGGTSVTYADWVQSHQLLPAVSAATAAPDGDGMPNLLKFALGLEPGVKATNAWVEPLSDGAGLRLSRSRTATGIALILQFSDNLATWKDLSTVPAVSGGLDAGRDWVVLSDPSPIPAGTARFYRLKVSQSGAPVPVKLVVGPAVEVLNKRVGQHGATVAVSNPADPLGGLEFTFPPDVLPGETPLVVQQSPILGHQFGQDINPITPLIQVQLGTNHMFLTNDVVVKIPIKLPPDTFAMGFLYDRDTGSLEGMPLVELTTNSISLGTRHFSNFFISMIPIDRLAEEVDTGFKPGVDDWEFTNYGSWVAKGGHCAGQTASAMWYYYEKKLKEGAPPLHNRFDNQGYSFRTPAFGNDNVDGYKMASMVQSDIDFHNFSNQFWFNLGLSDLNTYQAFVYSMQVTHEPQYMSIYGDVGGHAIAAYGASGGTIHVADPNFPGDTTRVVDFNPTSGTFNAYSSGANAQDLKHAFTRFKYRAKTTQVDWNKIHARWAEFEAGTIGEDEFPCTELFVFDPASTNFIGTVETDALLMPTNYTSSQIVQFMVTSKSEAKDVRISVVDTNGLEWATGSTGWQIGLFEGTNVIGVQMFDAYLDGARTKTAWIGFQWIAIVRTNGVSADCAHFKEVHVTGPSIYAARRTSNPQSSTKVYRVDAQNRKQCGCREYFDVQETKLYAEGLLENDKRQGVWKSYSSAGTLVGAVTFVDDARTGPFSFYYSGADGTGLKSQGLYARNDTNANGYVFHGRYKEYWPNHNQKSFITYNFGVTVGAYENYFQDGTISDSGELEGDGILTGVHRTYNTAGKLVEETSYSHNVWDGVRREWDGQGFPEYVQEFVNGHAVGWYTEYYPGTRQVAFRYWLTNGIKNGEYKTWYKTGQLQYSATYQSNLLDGVSKQWTIQGKLAAEISYHLGKFNGPSKSFYPSGALEVEKSFKEGVQTGLETGWYENGHKEHEGMMANDKPTGIWTYYNQDGVVINTIHYP